MYLPNEFTETNANAIQDVIKSFPLATLVAQTSEGLTANQLPLLMVGSQKIIGHVAFANRFHELATPEQDVLAIFSGANAYVSPNWYPSKAETHKQVPTWN